MTRDSVSRPTWSVPNSACASGSLCMRRKFVLSGSCGATQGAAMAMSTMSKPTRPPIADRVLPRAKPMSSRTTQLRSDVATSSGIADARVEQRVAQVHQEVHHDEDHRVEQDEVLDDDDVALDQRGHERAPEAGDAEGLLHRHR